LKIHPLGTRVITLLVLLILYLSISGLLHAQQEDASRDEPGSLRFAVIGDFGSGNQDEQDVADLVESWDVDFIITTGDNYYLSARGFGGNGLNQYDNSVGKFYCHYLKDTAKPDSGTLDCPPDRQSKLNNRFFPTIGNHDRHDTTSTGVTSYLDYFTLPGAGFENSSGNERYYDFVQGPVHFFAIDSDTARRDSDDMVAQKAWLKEQLGDSTSAWNVVYFHQSAYSSANHGSDPVMQWPFAEWGADAVFQGHDHVYERILHDDIVYFISGNGGKNLYEFDTAISGSIVRYDSGFGAMLITATDMTMEFEAWTVHDERQEQKEATPALIDIYHLPALQEGCTAANVAIKSSTDDAVQDQVTGRMDLSTADLAMVESSEGKQFVGLRFDGVNIPPGKKIHSATIEFTAREYETAQSDLLIYGQEADNPAGFTPTYDDIWSRPRTTARVEWNNLAAWGRTSPRTKYLSADLSAIVQEIVDRDGWKSGNAMAFVIDGWGRRTAYAYDHGLHDPALLSAVYCDPPDIGDEVWVDLNDNGVHEPKEPPRAGVIVNLWSTGADGEIGGDDDQLIAGTISGNQGYGFHNLQNGTYYVEFVRPDDNRYSLLNQGSRDETDSDADPDTGFTQVFQFDGRQVTDIDAGFSPAPPEINANSVAGWIDNMVAILPWVLVIILGSVIVIAVIVYAIRRLHQVSQGEEAASSNE
jgi:hypothetical protein